MFDSNSDSGPIGSSSPGSNPSSAEASHLPPHPSLVQLRKQAKELLRDYRAGDAAARARFRSYSREAADASAAPDPILSDAQFIIAREYGFESWPKLVRFIQTLGPAERLEQFERLATDIVAAYNGNPGALVNVNRLFSHAFTLEQLRELIGKSLKTLTDAIEPAEYSVGITIHEAKLFIARQHGFGSWSDFAQSFSHKPPDPRSLPQGMSSTPPFYRIDWQTNTISPGPFTSRKDWNTIIEVIKELKITGITAEGCMTDCALELISQLDHVTRLYLGGTGRISDAGLKHLARMPQLQELDLSDYPGGQISDRGLECLRHLPELRSFHMCWQRAITDAGLANLAFCDRLEDVDLLGTHTGDATLKALAGKHKLRLLRTGRLVTDAGLSLLHHFPVFKTYHGGEVEAGLMSFAAEPNNLLIDGPFTSTGLAALQGLQGLFGLSFFWHTSELKGEDLKALSGLPHLGFLGCQDELCDNDAMRHIASLPRLRALMCQGTVATDDGFVSLCRSETIAHIWGRDCPNLTGRGFASLASMPSLRGIAVSCKNVDDEALSSLPRFPALTELVPMDVKDPGFRHVGRCERLESLVMMYCQDTTDVATEQIKGLSKLKKYYAGGTKITDRTLEILGGMESLERIEFDNCLGITDAGLTYLAGLPGLQQISIAGSPKVTRAGTGVFPPNVRVRYV